MRTLLLIIFLLPAALCFSQKDSSSHKKHLIGKDSILTNLQKFDDSVAEDSRKKEELKEMERTNEQSLNYFAELSKERKAKEKKRAIIRIGLGIAFLVLLVFGLRRRSKKKT